MSDDAAIRKANLKRLCKARHWEMADLKAHAGRHYSFWPALLNGDKSFGEKLARSIEDQLELPRGWLDRDDTVPPIGTREPPASYEATDWPFSAELHRAVKRLKSADLAHLEGVMRAHLKLEPASVARSKQTKAA